MLWFWKLGKILGFWILEKKGRKTFLKNLFLDIFKMSNFEKYPQKVAEKSPCD